MRDLVSVLRSPRRTNPLHGARRLREFARRGRYGCFARPPARLRYVSDALSANVSASSGAARFCTLRDYLARNDGSSVSRKSESSLCRRRESRLKLSPSPQPDRLAGLELLIVHDMFLTETAQRADVVLPAASTYEKDGTLTNTAGEVQMTHRSIDPHGPAQRFRFDSYSFASARNARPRYADQTAHGRSGV